MAEGTIIYFFCVDPSNLIEAGDMSKTGNRHIASNRFTIIIGIITMMIHSIIVSGSFIGVTPVQSL
jgi:hypothetical protein